MNHYSKSYLENLVNRIKSNKISQTKNGNGSVFCQNKMEQEIIHMIEKYKDSKNEDERNLTESLVISLERYYDFKDKLNNIMLATNPTGYDIHSSAKKTSFKKMANPVVNKLNTKEI